MPTVTLTDDQKETAVEILHRIEDGEIDNPEDVVDEWKAVDPRERGISYKDNFESCTGYVDPDDIVGTTENVVHRLEPNRLAQILVWMLNSEFEQERKYPPNLIQLPDGTYYVASDGIHRSLASKAVGLDQLYVEYEVPS